MTEPFDMTLDRLAGLESGEVVTRDLLVKGAGEHPDRRLTLFEDGSTWTWRQALEQACAAANVLRSAGLGQDQILALILPNGPDFLRAWWGAALLGATILPINPALRGGLLERPLVIGQPAMLVTTPELAEPLSSVPACRDLALIDAATLAGDDVSLPALAEPIGLWAIEKLLLTSGTTGPSKLVQVPYLHAYWGYTTILKAQDFAESDSFLIDVPLFHSAALGYTNATLAVGSGICVRSRPVLDSYWEIARDAGVTGAVLISSMVTALMTKDPRPADREHRIRFMLTSPVPVDVDAFKKRFGVSTVLTSFGSTETSAPVLGEARAGLDPTYCGEIRPGWDVLIVDARDQEVQPGTVGEAIVRCARPFVMTPGYAGDTGATARAFRNGWFHTGDLLRRDADGCFYFVGRAKDVIRRRGENISAYEVEVAVAEHPGVAEVACVPVPSDDGVEDEVKAWVVTKPGAAVSMAELLEHSVRTLPSYMVPRYFELIDTIPKTPTGKAQKFMLLDRGNSASTWDRAANGFAVTRRGLERHEIPGSSGLLPVNRDEDENGFSAP
jgi:crotonobetaine/carnitine-CoA ligase